MKILLTGGQPGDDLSGNNAEDDAVTSKPQRKISVRLAGQRTNIGQPILRGSKNAGPFEIGSEGDGGKEPAESPLQHVCLVG